MAQSVLSSPSGMQPIVTSPIYVLDHSRRVPSVDPDEGAVAAERVGAASGAGFDHVPCGFIVIHGATVRWTMTTCPTPSAKVSGPRPRPSPGSPCPPIVVSRRFGLSRHFCRSL
jgi:hypothetical protein